MNKLNSHYKDSHNWKKFPCTKCEQTFPSNSEQRKHIRQVHFVSHFLKCCLCQYETNTNTSLESHIKNVHGKRRKFCSTENRNKNNGFESPLFKLTAVSDVQGGMGSGILATVMTCELLMKYICHNAFVYTYNWGQLEFVQ